MSKQKLYYFGIGGTGSRVLKSLIFLLASGVSAEHDIEIIPILIDRDLGNGDLNYTEEILRTYERLYKKIHTQVKNCSFLRIPIKKLRSGLTLSLKDNTQKFSDFIQLSNLDSTNKAFLNLLFSEQVLNMDVTVGFQGNPNVGSIVMNQFEEGDVFEEFAKEFSDPNSKIFIASSIFGGTGASGFPLLRRILQTPNFKDQQGKELPNWGLINKAKMAAITVLPYFNVHKAPNEESLVDGDTFFDKAKAALHYYKNENQKLDTFYYIGDTRTKTYEHHFGGYAQKNNAHFVELAAALAVLDFANPNNDSDNIKRNSANEITETVYKEFGIQEDTNQITFETCSPETKKIILEPLSRFMLFSKYILGPLQNDTSFNENQSTFSTEKKYQPYAIEGEFNKDKFLNSEFFSDLKKFQKEYMKWLLEMSQQERSFKPFDLSSKEASTTLQSYYQIGRFKNDVWAALDDALNHQFNQINTRISKDHQEALFMELFSVATTQILKNNQ